jgi:hypothetical protein
MQCDDSTLFAYTLGIRTVNTQTKNAQRVCKPSHEEKTKIQIDKEVRWLINRNMSGAQRPAIITG